MGNGTAKATNGQLRRLFFERMEDLPDDELEKRRKERRKQVT